MATSATQRLWLWLLLASVLQTAREKYNRQPTLAALERRDVRLDGLVGPLDRVEAARPLAPFLRRPVVEIMRPLVRMIFEHEPAPRLARGRGVEGARAA